MKNLKDIAKHIDWISCYDLEGNETIRITSFGHTKITITRTDENGTKVLYYSTSPSSYCPVIDGLFILVNRIINDFDYYYYN